MSAQKLAELLRTQLDDLKKQGLYKKERQIQGPQGSAIRVGGREVINFCANNYLGLANHPAIVEAAHDGLRRYGYGMASVRFICGTQDLHKQLEADVARFLGKDDAILYSSCWDANGGLFETILGEQDAILSDELNHASIIDGIRLCKAQRYRYKNCDMADLENGLKEAAGSRLRLIATDGVFSMDGSLAPLPDICALADQLRRHRHGRRQPCDRHSRPRRPRHGRASRRAAAHRHHHQHAGQDAGRSGRRLHLRPGRRSSIICGSVRGPISSPTPCRRRSSWPPTRPWS